MEDCSAPASITLATTVCATRSPADQPCPGWRLRRTWYVPAAARGRTALRLSLPIILAGRLMRSSKATRWPSWQSGRRALSLHMRPGSLPRRLVGADDLEVLVDEDVVRPVDADGVDLVVAVAQLHDAGRRPLRG